MLSETFLNAVLLLLATYTLISDRQMIFLIKSFIYICFFNHHKKREGTQDNPQLKFEMQPYTIESFKLSCF